MSVHLYCCSFCRLRTEEFQDFLRNREKRPRKKLVLPPVIPWEYGSNKFASQKGTGGFGKLRNTTVSAKSSKQLSEGSNGDMSRLMCPNFFDKELGTQSGQTPFGSIRGTVFKVKDYDVEEPLDVWKLSILESEGFLKLLSTPNPDAKITKPFGNKRNEVTETVGGRQFTPQELQASRAAIPRFQDPRNTIAAKAEKEQRKKNSSGNLVIPQPFAHLAVQQPRIIRTSDSTSNAASVELLNFDGQEINQLTAEQYMAWLGGQLTVQSKKGAAQQQPKNRSYASFYDRLMIERTPTKREIREKLKKLQLEAKLSTPPAETSNIHDDQRMLANDHHRDSDAQQSNNVQTDSTAAVPQNDNLITGRVCVADNFDILQTAAEEKNQLSTIKSMLQKSTVPELSSVSVTAKPISIANQDGKKTSPTIDKSSYNSDSHNIDENIINNNNNNNSSNNGPELSNPTVIVSNSSMIISRTLANETNNNNNNRIIASAAE